MMNPVDHTIQLARLATERKINQHEHYQTESKLVERIRQLEMYGPGKLLALLADEDTNIGCKPLHEEPGAVTNDILPSPATNEFSEETCIPRFLAYVYQEIDGVLDRCVTQSSSRSNTPVSVARQTPPIYGGKSTAARMAKPCDKPDTKQNDHLAKQSYKESRDSDRNQLSGRKTPRRVQLFSAADSSANTQPPLRNHQTEPKTPQPIRVKPSPVHGNLAPLQSSTPNALSNRSQQYNYRPLGHNHSMNHSNQSNHSNNLNHSLTLADFVTPDRRKTKRNSRKQTPKSSNSTPCGSWASGIGERDITPLREGEAMSDISNSHQTLDQCANKSGTQVSSRKGSETCTNSISTSSKPSTSTTPSKPSRRITPTVVSSESVWHGFRQQAVFEPHSPKKAQPEPVPGSFDNERQRLKEKKAQLMTPIVDKDSASFSSQLQATPSKPHLSRLTSEQCVEPYPELVTFTDKLDKAASMFADLVSAGKTHNITADLHLLVQVLCCQIPEVSNTESKRISPDLDLLHSVHNAVYFAVHVLQHCCVLQNIFDSGITRVLGENERIIRFSPLFASILQAKRLDGPHHCINQSSFSSVSFQADTDNSKNFPSERTFIVFKKQRDLFYEVKREWDTNHAVAGWSFKVRCSEKIFNLLNNGGVDVSNYVHLARLFVNQLIVSCLKDVDEGWTEADDESVSLLSDLKLTQPEKYRKLRERFVMPFFNSSQLSREVTFTGQESFFKLFIDVAKDATFTQHLKDTFTLKLLTLNQTEFEGLGDPDCDVSAAQNSFSDCILTARLVAKFLGYLNFLPYLGNEKVNPVLDEQYQLLRAVTAPPLDVKQLIDEAVKEGRCRVLIPWLVQYLSHIDQYSMSMPYYKQILGVLHKYFHQLKSSLNCEHGIEDIMLQYVCLSWLFNLAQFEDLEEMSEREFKVKDSLSGSSLVCVKLVYECSEILRCVKGLLVEFVMGMKSKVSVSRKITPLTAESSRLKEPTNEITASSPTSNLQQILEDNFFQNQAASLKKSVGFVAERVSSSYIKEFRAGDLADGLSENRLYMYTKATQVEVRSELKAQLASVVESRAKALWNNLHEQAVSGVRSYFDARVKSILQLLLPSDTESYIIEICSTVILRQGLDRVVKWLKTNLTLKYITAELNQELVKFCRSNGKGAAPNTVVETFAQLGFDHSDIAPPPSETFMDLQNFTGNILANPKGAVASEDLEAILSQTVLCITGRSDIVLIALKSMCHLLVMLFVSLATHHQEVLTPAAMDHYSNLLHIEGLKCYWDSLVKAVPVVQGWNDDNDSSGTLQEKLWSYMLFQRGLLTVTNK